MPWGPHQAAAIAATLAGASSFTAIAAGLADQTMATLRNTAISLHRLDGTQNITAALRHHDRRPGKIIMVLTCTARTLS